MDTNFFPIDFLFLSWCDVCFYSEVYWKLFICLFCAILGAINVQVATVSKQDRQHTVEVYTAGFVPSYLLRIHDLLAWILFLIHL